MAIFTRFLQEVDSLGVRLQNIRIWQNGRTIYSRYNEDDYPKPYEKSKAIVAFLEKYGDSNHNHLSCALLEKYALNCLSALKAAGDNRPVNFVADNGQACSVYPEENVVVSINAATKDQCAIVVDLFKDYVLPDLRNNPRDNTLLNFLDTIYDEE